ncbi:MAG: hypothetical protein ACM3NV_05215 [Syntrophothermus sp.]
MTLDRRTDMIVRVAAAAIGAAAVIALIAMARPAAGHGGVLPASLRFAADQDPALAISPAAPRAVLRSDALRPGGHASGALHVRNQTGAPLVVGLRGEPSSTALDGVVDVRVRSDGRTLADSTLGSLRRGTQGRIRLASGEGASFRLTARLPAAVATGYEGSRVSVRLFPVYRRAP